MHRAPHGGGLAVRGWRAGAGVARVEAEDRRWRRDVRAGVLCFVFGGGGVCVCERVVDNNKKPVTLVLAIT